MFRWTVAGALAGRAHDRRIRSDWTRTPARPRRRLGPAARTRRTRPARAARARVASWTRGKTVAVAADPGGALKFTTSSYGAVREGMIIGTNRRRRRRLLDPIRRAIERLAVGPPARRPRDQGRAGRERRGAGRGAIQLAAPPRPSPRAFPEGAWPLRFSPRARLRVMPSSTLATVSHASTADSSVSKMSFQRITIIGSIPVDEQVGDAPRAGSGRPRSRAGGSRPAARRRRARCAGRAGSSATCSAAPTSTSAIAAPAPSAPRRRRGRAGRRPPRRSRRCRRARPRARARRRSRSGALAPCSASRCRMSWTIRSPSCSHSRMSRARPACSG